MKKLKFWVLSFLWLVWETRQKRRFAAINSNEYLLVVDIDNTLTKNKLNEPVNHTNPNPRNGVIKYVREAIDDGDKVIYLSARDFRLYDRTIIWLKAHDLFEEGRQSLFLVKTSLAKIPYLHRCIDRNDRVTIIDDLSYNHENGKIKYHEETKLRLEQMRLKLLSMDFINSL